MEEMREIDAPSEEGNTPELLFILILILHIISK